jgi:two-component system phosphate regulon response regulator PhoB
VREVEDGFDALQAIGERVPDLLIVDDVLPGLSGVELVQALRGRDEFLSLRIAFLVEYPSGLRRAALVGLHEDAIIRKPFDLDELSNKVRAIVSAAA